MACRVAFSVLLCHWPRQHLAFCTLPCITQTVELASTPDWVTVTDAEGGAGPWHLEAQASRQLLLQAAAIREGRLRELLVFRLDGSTAEVKLVLAAAIVKAASGTGGLGALGKPQRVATAAAEPTAWPRPAAAPATATLEQQQRQQVQGEKRGRATAGLGTPVRRAAAAAQVADGGAGSQAGTPSVQQPKRMHREAVATRPTSRLGGSGGSSAAAPDPSTPRQPRTMALTEAPGSIDASTHSRTPRAGTSRLAAGASRPGGSPGGDGSFGVLGRTLSGGMPSRLGASPGGGGPRTFTGVHTAWMDKQERAFKVHAHARA